VQFSLLVQPPLVYLLCVALLLLSLPPYYLLWRVPPEQDSLRWQIWGPYALILPLVSIFITVYDLVWETNQTHVYGLPGLLGFVVHMAASFVLWISLLLVQMKALNARSKRLQLTSQPLEQHLWEAEPVLKQQDEGPEAAVPPCARTEEEQVEP
jgi:hypothetical protein